MKLSNEEDLTMSLGIYMAFFLFLRILAFNIYN